MIEGLPLDTLHLQGNLVTQQIKKQLVVRSSAQVNFRDMTFEVCEFLLVENALPYLDLQPKQPMNLYSKNNNCS